MIISVEQISSMIDLDSFPNTKLVPLLASIERMIRKETNNHFCNKSVRFLFSVINGNLVSYGFHHLSVGDTIEVSESSYNKGYLGVIQSIEGDTITLDKPLEDEDGSILVSRVDYPEDIIQGVVNLVRWEVENRDKINIKSETISRHSVTYLDYEARNKNGYPSALMEFIKPYCKARF